MALQTATTTHDGALLFPTLTLTQKLFKPSTLENLPPISLQGSAASNPQLSRARLQRNCQKAKGRTREGERESIHFSRDVGIHSDQYFLAKNGA